MLKSFLLSIAHGMRVQLGFQPSCIYIADYKCSARMIEEPECKFTCNSGSFVIRIERDSACVLTAGQDTTLRESSGTHLHRLPIPSCKSEASCSVRSGTEEFYCICEVIISLTGCPKSFLLT